MYLPTVAFQTKIFFLSIGLGFLLGVLYDVFYLIRITFTKGKVAIYVQDVLYLLTCSFITFLYILSVSSGMVRTYILIGEILGWLIYYISAGYFIVNYATKGVEKSKLFAKKSVKTVSKPVKKVTNKTGRYIKKFFTMILGKKKKNYKKFKLGLKFRRNLLYNTVNTVDEVDSQIASNERNGNFD